MTALAHLAQRASSTLAYLSAREDKNCINEYGGDMCAVPVAGTKTTGIVIGSIGGVLALVIIVVLVHLHLRRQRMDAKEWNGKHTQELDDYGLGDAGATAKPQTAYRPATAQPPAAAAPPSSSIPTARRTSQDSLRSLENSLRHQQKPADMV
ncbi:cell wall integrity and stress response component [Microdochium nivale]|nr:cell wall integrity and stress response component [Microdochium nivale]